jgi:hypothetical protein
MWNFEDELEVYRREEEEAQQTFFAYIGVRDLIAQRPDVHALVNRNSMFWITTHHALLVSSFMAIGRIFDPASKHNVGRLIRAVENNRQLFTREALRQRKEPLLRPGQAEEYVDGKHELTVEETREIKARIDGWRKVYQDRYLEIRHHFAHKKHSTLDEINALIAKTNIEEMKSMFGFLHALHEALAEMYLNGRVPELRDLVFVLPPEPQPRNRQYYPGEKAYRQAQDALLMMLPN